MPDDEPQRGSWLRFFIRLTWVGCCVATLTVITLIGSQYLSNRRLMIMTKQTNLREPNPAITWQRRWFISLERLVGVDTEMALFFRPTELLVQELDTTDAKIVEVLQASSGLQSITIHNRDLPQRALKVIADRHDPQTLQFRLPVISHEDAACLSRMKSLKFVSFGQFDRQSRENDWSWLKHLPDLETLNVTLWSANRADVLALSQSPAVRNLSLSGDGVTDETLILFCNAPQLQSLDVEGPEVRLHFADGQQLPQSLTELELQWTAIDDQSLAAIAKLPRLRRVSIYGGKITDVAFVSQLPGLKQLWLNSLSDLTDEGLTSLSQSQSLTEILVEHCDTTPTALIHLNAIPNWTEIRFDNVTFRRSVGGAKPEITPENAAEILARQREFERMQNDGLNGPIIFPRR
ncbi:MAG: hypothetical protein JWP89_741 [Schlesneria sp.]|nr:hypothetical protein [Schlesneria sp.]